MNPQYGPLASLKGSDLRAPCFEGGYTGVKGVLQWPILGTIGSTLDRYLVLGLWLLGAVGFTSDGGLSSEIVPSPEQLSQGAPILHSII